MADAKVHSVVLVEGPSDAAALRALGPAAMEELLEAQGDLSAFRTYQKQPAHREETIEEQLHGFLWNRKLKYGVLIVDALDLDRIPRALAEVLAQALQGQDASP